MTVMGGYLHPMARFGFIRHAWRGYIPIFERDATIREIALDRGAIGASRAAVDDDVPASGTSVDHGLDDVDRDGSGSSRISRVS